MRLKTLFLLGAAAYAWKRFSDKGQMGTRQMRRHQERDLDLALDDSFPASDPPSMTTPSSSTSGIRSSDIKRH